MRAAIKYCMTAFLLLVLADVGWSQSAGLQFDPTWRVAAGSKERFSLAKSMMMAPHAQTNAMPQAWCYSDLAFFCKLEVNMEKATRFPIKFRLGDVRYVDQLEGKRQGY